MQEWYGLYNKECENVFEISTNLLEMRLSYKKDNKRNKNSKNEEKTKTVRKGWLMK